MSALQSCPALALRGKSPSLAVASPYGAPMPHIGRLSRLDCHTLPATTLRKVVAPIPSGQTGLDASRQAQFSASFVISM
nr:MAG TPA: hypothetical protein [Caudoviricetes sp.]